MDDITRAASAFGKLGGTSTSNKYGKAHYQRMQVKSVQAKKDKKVKASKYL
jgi:hypothetical protein